jgi:hypothetical protein
MTPDSEGLHEIANTTNADRVADIVFVHGLGGGSHSTWRFAEPGAPDHFFWPEELGKALPDCGIWSLGYLAGVSHWFGAPGMAVHDRAKNLVLKLQNGGLGDRPIIFVTHSLGGLEVKEIVVRTQTSGTPAAQRLVAQVCGIVFCGTPHRGAHVASAATILASYLRTPEHVKQLAMGSPTLDALHDEFIAWQSRTHVAVESYVERIGLFRARGLLRPLPLGLVVSVASGNPGIANAACYPVSDDHITLVKPRDGNHDVYAGVLRFIRARLAVLAQTERLRRESESEPPGDASTNVAIASAPLLRTTPPSPPASQSALSVWREKLEFLRIEDAACADPAMKFSLRHRIAEAEGKIRALGG